MDWKAFNNQLDDVLDNFTEKQWRDWKKNQESNRKLRNKLATERFNNHIKNLNMKFTLELELANEAKYVQVFKTREEAKAHLKQIVDGEIVEDWCSEIKDFLASDYNRESIVNAVPTKEELLNKEENSCGVYCKFMNIAHTEVEKLDKVRYLYCRYVEYSATFWERLKLILNGQ